MVFSFISNIAVFCCNVRGPRANAEKCRKTSQSNCDLFRTHTFLACTLPQLHQVLIYTQMLMSGSKMSLLALIPSVSCVSRAVCLGPSLIVTRLLIRCFFVANFNFMFLAWFDDCFDQISFCQFAFNGTSFCLLPPPLVKTPFQNFLYHEKIRTVPKPRVTFNINLIL